MFNDIKKYSSNFCEINLRTRGDKCEPDEIEFFSTCSADTTAEFKDAMTFRYLNVVREKNNTIFMVNDEILHFDNEIITIPETFQIVPWLKKSGYKPKVYPDGWSFVTLSEDDNCMMMTQLKLDIMEIIRGL